MMKATTGRAMRKDVYNLEFPSFIDGFTVGPYRFSRHPEYGSRLQRLQQLVRHHAEFEVSPCAGECAVTAIVEGPAAVSSAIFPDVDQRTALDDVLLVLSLFTGRDVFATEPGAQGVVVADPRQHRERGGILRCSVPYESANRNGGNAGFGKTLNAIYELLHDSDWQRRYERGYFLVLANHAFKDQPLEVAFTQCWTIWEHLFATMNSGRLSDDALRQARARDKIALIVHEFALKPSVGDGDRDWIRSLAEIRNRLVHHGRFPLRERVYRDAVLFCQITEFVVAKTLGLRPSNVFNTVERFEEFLRDAAQQTARGNGGGHR
jgi:hypothetical protein